MQKFIEAFSEKCESQLEALCLPMSGDKKNRYLMFISFVGFSCKCKGCLTGYKIQWLNKRSHKTIIFFAWRKTYLGKELMLIFRYVAVFSLRATDFMMWQCRSALQGVNEDIRLLVVDFNHFSIVEYVFCLIEVNNSTLGKQRNTLHVDVVG
jgi:hypothetical protein